MGSVSAYSEKQMSVQRYYSVYSVVSVVSSEILQHV